MSKIFLIGYMGVGKTTVGKVLSEKLNCDFIDPDDKEHWIRRGFPNGRSDAWHVSKEKFYDIETEILKDYIFSNVGNFVYSSAGSIVLREENVDLMKSRGTIIFLNANAKIIHDRLKNSDKQFHVSKNYNEEDVKEFMKGREPKYKFADLEIDTSDKSVEEVSSTIIKLLKL